MPFRKATWISRRAALAGLSASVGTLLLPDGLSARTGPLAATPAQSTGPFYPVSWAGDADNDLVIVRGEAAAAMGRVVHLTGRVLDLAGAPIKDAFVEIWQCDARGVYRHPWDNEGGRAPDAGFQGRGRVRTDAGGRYAFRTIRPVAYPGRTPHIHFKVDTPDSRRLVTQMYIFGEPLNARDGLLNAIRDPARRDALIVRLDPAEALETGALAGIFDIVIG